MKESSRLIKLLRRLPKEQQLEILESLTPIERTVVALRFGLELPKDTDPKIILEAILTRLNPS